MGVIPGTDKPALYARPEYEHLAALIPVVDAAAGADAITRAADPQDPGQAIAFVGLGSNNPTPHDLRTAAGAVARRMQASAALDFALPTTSPDDVIALLTGAGLGAYSYNAFKGSGSTKTSKTLNAIHVRTDVSVPARELSRTRENISAVQVTKDLVNTPPNALYPETFVAETKKLISGLPITASVWDEKRLAKDGFGGILGVGQGSQRPPRLVKLSYRPEQAKKHLALVGKGITFDSGGLSLKTPGGMVGMKYDMTGAATALAVVRAAAAMKLPLRITAWLALAENMPSGSAARPNDVLTIRGGKTVEVLNTDAEGRLVLADALVAASEERPDLIVDIATLTGAATVALGNRYAGALGDTSAVSQFVEVAENVGEQFWPMPLPSEMRAMLSSDVADIANAKPGNTAGGMLLGATFLNEFVGTQSSKKDAERIPWVHLDIASTANNPGGGYGWVAPGPTGTAVRALISLAERLAGK